MQYTASEWACDGGSNQCDIPTAAPIEGSRLPTSIPTGDPTDRPTPQPTDRPTRDPTPPTTAPFPTATMFPTEMPTIQPPTNSPVLTTTIATVSEIGSTETVTATATATTPTELPTAAPNVGGTTTTNGGGSNDVAVTVIIILCILIVIGCCVGGYFLYKNHDKSRNMMQGLFRQGLTLTGKEKQKSASSASQQDFVIKQKQDKAHVPDQSSNNLNHVIASGAKPTPYAKLGSNVNSASIVVSTSNIFSQDGNKSDTGDTKPPSPLAAPAELEKGGGKSSDKKHKIKVDSMDPSIRKPIIGKQNSSFGARSYASSDADSVVLRDLKLNRAASGASAGSETENEENSQSNPYGQTPMTHVMTATPRSFVSILFWFCLQRKYPK